MAASAMGGLRWVLTQLILRKEGLGLTHPVDTVYHVAPCMAVTLLPFAIAIEGKEVMQSELLFAGGIDAAMNTLIMIFLGACLAFCLTLSEFLLVSHTSSMTMSVGGIVKEICTILIAVVVGGETLTDLNILGLAVSICGIVYYNVIKFQKEFTSSKARYSKLQDHPPPSPTHESIEMEEL